MPFYIFAWIGSIASGLFVITAKLTSKHSISNPWLFNLLLVAITFFYTLPIAIYYNAGLPNNWVPIVLASIFLTLFNIFWIFATYALDVTVMTPLFSFRGVFAVLIGLLFLGEKLNFNQWFFIFIILIAGIFTSIDEKFNLKSFFKLSVLIAIVAMLCLAIYNAFIKVSLQYNSLWTNNLWIAFLNTLIILFTFPLFKKDLKKINSQHILPIGIMGLFSTFIEFAANAAYKVNLGISSLIMNLPFSMVLAFIFSVVAPKLLEKHSLKVYAIRFGAALVMIVCAMQLT